MTTSSVAIIILNWNNAPDTLVCLRSLEKLQYPNCQLFVVDNGSTDNSVAALRQAFPSVTILETGKNLGYAGGNNVGIRHALDCGSEYVCILNNDVTVAPDFLNSLLALFAAEENLGVTCPLIAEMNDPETIWALGASVRQGKGDTIRHYEGERVSAFRNASALEVQVAPGTAMLIKREVFGKVGLLDESFFLYYEETDWCLKVRRAGYRILAVPASVVWHKVSSTLGQTSPVIDYYMLRNQLLFTSHHWSGLALLGVQGRIVLRNVATIMAYTVHSHSGQRQPHRNARLLALRDAILGRWGKMGLDVQAVCYPAKR